MLRSLKTIALLGVSVVVLSAFTPSTSMSPNLTSGGRVLAHTQTQTCSPAQLKVVLGRTDAAMGHLNQVVRFVNIGPVTCALRGYPRLQMLSRSGAAIATHDHDGTNYTVPILPIKVVTLAFGKSATFQVGYAAATGYGSAVCPTSARIRVFPPASQRPIVVVWRLQPYGGPTIAKLHCGDLTLSPVY